MVLEISMVFIAILNFVEEQQYEISSSHGGEYEVQICLLGCTAV
jgi:hypothetical protein